MKTSFIVLLILVILKIDIQAQSTTLLPGSGIFDNNSTSQALQIPKLAYSQILSIPNPTAGMLVYDTDTPCLRSYNGSQWISISDANNCCCSFQGQGAVTSSILATSTYYAGYAGQLISNKDYTIDSQNKHYLVGTFAGVPFNNQTCYYSTNYMLPSSQFRPTGYLMMYQSDFSTLGCFTINGKNLASSGQPYTYSDFESAVTGVFVKNTDVYITGYFNRTITVGSTDYTATGFDSFLAKLNTSGQLVWIKKITSGTGDEKAMSLTSDNVGTLYVGGNFNSNIVIDNSTNLTHNGNGDIFIGKFDEQGSLLSAAGFGGTNAESIANMAFKYDLFVSGTFTNSTQIGTLSATGGSGTNLLVCKINSSLTPNTLTSFNTTGSFTPVELKVLFDPNLITDQILISGRINGQSTIGTESVQNNGFLMSLSPFSLNVSKLFKLTNGTIGKIAIKDTKVYVNTTSLGGLSAIEGVPIGGASCAILKFDLISGSLVFSWFKKIGLNYQNNIVESAQTIALNSLGNVYVPYMYYSNVVLTSKVNQLKIAKYTE